MTAGPQGASGREAVIVIKIVLPVIAGGVAAALTMWGLVQMQTQAPETNPASEQILTYGD